MQVKNGSIITIVIICSVLLGALIYFSIPEIPNPDVPTAAEIAALVVIPDIEQPITFLSLRQDLKDDALEVCDSEFDFDEVEDLFHEDDEVEYTKEYTDRRHYSNIRLGIDNKDDRKVTIDRVYKIAVEKDNGDEFNDKVYVECDVTSDDGDLEADLTYTL